MVRLSDIRSALRLLKLRIGIAPVLFLAVALACGPGEDHSESGVEPGGEKVPADVASVRPEPAARVGELAIYEPRMTLVPGVGAVYLEISNESAASDRLTGVDASIAEDAQMHESLDDGGVMRMVPRPDGFEVPANGRLILEPSGKHIMLLEPELPSGVEMAWIALVFEHAGRVEFEVSLLRGVAGSESTEAAMDHSDHTAH